MLKRVFGVFVLRRWFRNRLGVTRRVQGLLSLHQFGFFSNVFLPFQVLHRLWPLPELVPRSLRGHLAKRGQPHRRVRLSSVPVNGGRHDGFRTAHWQGLRGPAQDFTFLTGREMCFLLLALHLTERLYRGQGSQSMTVFHAWAVWFEVFVICGLMVTNLVLCFFLSQTFVFVLV